MIYLSLFFIIQAFGADIACNLHECPPVIVTSKQQGDGNCDLNCMSPYCNYDSGSVFQSFDDRLKSDCYEPC
ncbi:unnamed protein product [Blepharisma stoltei]|uniref:LNR domain-containing protein n=1 Tax=Blepharisma stoltei TaxID=1481888 RepID=A0AAU9IEP5_9CILI|nr:unnamed protein product [Blepharisma stoltei]